ncbi:MAG: flagellin [Roseburia sp.]|nr:flagellin [Roseburia sp.]
MKINANIPAFITNKQLLHIEGNMAASIERLSSGLKINHAKDNPAGMAISNKMRAQIAGLDRASNNASDAMAAIRIADGALNEASSIMQRMRELAVQAANDTNGLEDRQAIQHEIDALKEEVNRISRDTEYNEMPLLDGSLSARVYADNVSRISTTDAVSAGKYQVNVLAEAEQAVITGDANTAFADPTGTTQAGTSGRVTVNGYSVDVEETDTAAEVYEKIRKAAEVGGATLEKDASGALVFTTEKYGQAATLKVEFSSEDFAKDLGFTNVKLNSETNQYETEFKTGSDAQVTLTKKSASPEVSEFSDTATARTDGNKVIITDHAGFEMSFLIDEAFTTGAIDLEVTDIGTMTVHIGANENQNMVISVPEVSSESLYIDDIDVTKMGGASEAISRLDEAINAVSSARSKLGAYENRLDYSVASLDAFEENMTEAQSRLTDTDMAQEMTTYTQQNVLNQAAISVLSQANDMPQQVLQLLQ